MQKRNGPLDGIRVLAVEQHIAIPVGTMWLADAGAEVIKIEPPGKGEAGRDAAALGFLRFNRNKKSMTLDFRTKEGAEIFKELVNVSDVVAENMRPGLMESLGLGYEELKKINPRIIYVATSGYGRLGQTPYSSWPSYDMVIQGMAGILNLVGEKGGPPLFPGVAIADVYSSFVAAYGVLLALIERGETGVGQFIDNAMYDDVLALNDRPVIVYSLTGKSITRGEERLYSPHGCYKCKDGYMACVIATDRDWNRFSKAIGKDEWIDNPDFDSKEKRIERHDSHIKPAFEKWMEEKTKKEVVDAFLTENLPIGPVQTGEDIFNCPQTRARNMLIEMKDPGTGKEVTLVGPPLKLSSMTKTHEPAPVLGMNTEEVLTNILHYSKQDSERLRKKGII